MNRPIKILAILPALIPSSIILIVEPLLYLAGLGKVEVRVRLEHLYVRASDLEWADLVVFCRNTEPAYNDILQRVLALKKPYLYELDDNFFELPLNSPEGRYHRTSERIDQLVRYITDADLVRVYSLPLQTRAKQYTLNATFVKAPVNLFSIPNIPPYSGSGRLKIVFSTSRTIADDLSQIFVKDLIRVINEFGNTIEVHFWGFMPEELKHFPSVKFHRFLPNYQKYMRKMYRQGYDIGLAPMKNDVFHNSKTNNKFREYGACWIAGIYSNSEVYSNCVEDGVTGLLVSNDEGEWYQAIVRMMMDVELRKAIQLQARAIVEKEYSLEKFTEILLNDINTVLREFVQKETIRVDNVQKTENVKFENENKPKSLFLRLFDLIRFVFGKMRRLLNDYGMLLVFRLIIDEIGRYAQYCLLSYRIKLVRIYYIIAHFLDRFRLAG
jgi:glycosyltransferase involved in cell wall biosynthesis